MLQRNIDPNVAYVSHSRVNSNKQEMFLKATRQGGAPFFFQDIGETLPVNTVLRCLNEPRM